MNLKQIDDLVVEAALIVGDYEQWMGFALRPLPQPIDELSWKLADAVRQLSEDRFAAASELFKDQHALILLGCAERAAAMGVRTGDSLWLRRAVTLVLLENTQFDYRETICSLAAIWDATERIVRNPREFLSQEAAWISNHGTKQIDNFIARAPAQRALGQFWLRPAVDANGGFIYENLPR